MGRAPCCEKNGLKKGPWTPEEDQKLVDYIQKHGHGSWRTLPKNAGLSRCGKSCRLRWTNYLRPDIKRGRFSFDEEETIIQLHSILGNKWSAIAARLPGRTDNEIKNYWNTHIRKRLVRMGIDPITHIPRLDLSSLLITNPNLLLNPQAPFDVSKLLGLEVNPEFLRVASNLLSSQSQNSNLFQLQNQFQQVPSSPQFFNINDQPQFSMQHNVQDHFQTTTSVWQANGLSCNFPDTFAPVATGGAINGYENLELSVPQFVSEDTNFFLSGNQSYDTNMTNSVVSSPPTQLNSSSTYISGSTEDERDMSYCSELFNFQIPDLLDVRDYM